MKDSYDRYKWAKLQRQELLELAQGFDNEVDPSVVRVEGRLVRLEGGLEDRYREWRRILAQIIELETGVAPAPSLTSLPLSTNRTRRAFSRILPALVSLSPASDLIVRICPSLPGHLVPPLSS